jgi:hypothetical protein
MRALSGCGLMNLPPIVDMMTRTYLTEVDATAPGLVEGLYVTGSAALGDFKAGGRVTRWGPSGASSSDIDFVAVTSQRVDAALLARLAAAHDELRRRHRRPFFDGMYLTWDDLRRDPAGLSRYPAAHEGRLTSGKDPPTPVLWHELADHGRSVRGPELTSVGIWTDQDALRAWCRENLAGYWRRWLDRSRRVLDPWALSALTHYGPAWGVLGVSRIDYTLSTGAITSKTGAGRHARVTFGSRWHRIIDESVRIRSSSSRRPIYLTPFARRREALRFVGMVLQRHGVDIGVGATRDSGAARPGP